MRVLALRPRALGDVVLVTPALRALAASGAELEVVTEARYRPLLEGLDGIARVSTLERDTAGTLRLIGDLRRRRFDLAVDFFGNSRTALIARLSARRTAGYALRGRQRLYDLVVPRALEFAPGTDGRPRREYAAATHVRLAVAAGGVSDGIETRVALPDRSAASAESLLRSAGIRDPRRAIGLVAAGTWPTKMWPVGHSGMLAQSLLDAGWEVLLLSGPGEEAVSSVVRRHAPTARELPSCGVGDLAAVIHELAAVVGTDSGPRHLAAALGVPTFAWFGPTHPDTWSAPFASHGFWRTDLPCRGCDRTACPHWNCMPSLRVAAATRLVLEHLERHDRFAAAVGTAAGA